MARVAAMCKEEGSIMDSRVEGSVVCKSDLWEEGVPITLSFFDQGLFLGCGLGRACRNGNIEEGRNHIA